MISPFCFSKTHETLKAIATEYAKGRLLLMATTHLDARQAVIWNKTKIAASGHPDALKRFHQIMLASLAIPEAFTCDDRCDRQWQALSGSAR